MPRYPRAPVLIVFAGCMLALACGTDGLDPDEGVVAAVVLSPTKASILVGETVALDATLLDADGERLTDPSISWTSSNPSIARVESGVVTGVHDGDVTITAGAQGRTAAARITVRFPATRMFISPESPTLPTGTSVQLHATVLDPRGEVIEDRIVEWETSNARIALVSVGKVRGLRVGAADIVARTGLLSATTTITVLPNINGLWQLGATVEDAGRGLVCRVEGTLSVVQIGAGIGGAHATTATCTGPDGTAELQGASQMRDASLGGLHLDFLLTGPLNCSYTGDLTGLPISGAGGDVSCSGTVGAAAASLSGTWQMVR